MQLNQRPFQDTLIFEKKKKFQKRLRLHLVKKKNMKKMFSKDFSFFFFTKKQEASFESKA